MKVIIDRFEGKYAVCEAENGEMVNIPADDIPSGCKEGDILVIEGDTVKADKLETQKTRDEIEGLAGDLWK